MDIDKSKAYKKLVKAMQDKYPKHDKNSSDNYELYAPYVNGEMICQEINLYTYCQGLGYADNTPKIKYLFVAQDYGFLLKHGINFIDKIKKINAGNKNIPYIDNELLLTSNTTKNLIPLFKKIGYDITKRNNELFFTNFCLGYRRDKEVKMTKELMMSDAALFKELCEILEPENIICMGMKTFECVYEVLEGKPNEEILKYNDFNRFLEEHEPITIRLKGSPIPIIPVAHSGEWGIINRNCNIDDPLYNQYRDWIEIKKLIRDYKYETIDDAFKSRKDSFADFLFKLIDEKHLTDAYVYGKAGIIRKIFSDIRNKSDYFPSKKTIVAIIFALELSIEDALELLSRAGYILSPSSDFDLVVTHFISLKNFDQQKIDEELDRRGLDCIFSKK